MRTIRGILDNNSTTFLREIVLVPLSDLEEPECATLFLEDYQRLMDGGVSDVWYQNKDKSVVIWGKLIKRALLVSRLIMDARAGEIVKYRDGDALNLRSSNLYKALSNVSKIRDWDYVSPNTHNNNPRCKCIFEYSAQTKQSNWLNGLQQQELKRQTEITSFKL